MFLSRPIRFFPSFPVVCLLFFLSLSGIPAQTQGAPDGQHSPSLPASLSGFRDEGTFLLYKNEDRLAEISFQWKLDGTFENRTVLSMAGQSVTLTLKIAPGEDGHWTHFSMESPRGPISAVREGNVVRWTLKEKTETVALKPGSLITDNLAPALMSRAVRSYDTVKGGRQSFPVLIIPNVMESAVLEFQGRAERSIGGKDVEFRRFLYSVRGTDVTLWVDGEGRLYLADVPSQHAAYVREGYEILRQASAGDPLLSSPKYQVTVERNVRIPMRDGMKLSSDIYRPDARGRFPVVLARTPYRKEMAELQARYYARRGYIFVAQDCRGRFSSPGVWEPFVNESKDGYDTVEWLAGRPWSTGKVGMIGASYAGGVQWWAVSEHPPHLATIIPNVSPPDPFFNIPYEYGVFFLTANIWWTEVLESGATADISGAALGRIGEKKYHKLLRTLPVIDLDQKVLGKKSSYWRKWIEHPVNDSYWKRGSFLYRLKSARIPVFHQSGWFDGDGIGSKLNYLRMTSHGHPNQKLILGPWGHTPESHRRVGDRDFGPEAIVDMQRTYLRWFDYWLKGVPNGIIKEPLVSIFAMGSNKWLHDQVYPLSRTRFQKWYLSSEGHANTSKGDGYLSPGMPLSGTPSDRYYYDPGDPTPDPNFYEDSDDDQGGKKIRSREEKKKDYEAYHENVTRGRKDILVYLSDPFTQPLTFAGPLSAVLYASSSARDTDWFMRLSEVDKDGKIFQLAEGKIRARFRRSTHRPELLKAGRIYEYRIDLWQTGITIPVGHRLRVEVASASFPTFSRNLNTGGHNETETRHVRANQVIHHDRAHPSHILLPVIP